MIPAPETVVTGVGLVTCLGVGLAATLAALERGERVRGQAPRHLIGTPHEKFRVAPEPDLEAAGQAPDRRMRKFMSRQAELSAAAARQALAEADPAARGLAPERLGLYAGVGLAAVDPAVSSALLRASIGDDGFFDQDRFGREGLRAIHPLWTFHTLANMPPAIVSVLENIKGDNGIYTPLDDHSAFAVLEAAHALERGDIDAAVVVAADTPSHPASLVELASAGYLSPEDIAASAAACLVLERPGTSARPLARLRSLSLEAASEPPADPLAPVIGRTVAAAPLALIALAARLNLPRRLVGCGGHRFSFEVE